MQREGSAHVSGTGRRCGRPGGAAGWPAGLPPPVGLKCGGPRLVVTEVVGLTVGSDTDVDRILVGI